MLRVYTDLFGKSIDMDTNEFIYGKMYSQIKSGELILGPTGPTIYINHNLIESIQNEALVCEPDTQRIFTENGFKEVPGMTLWKVRDDHELNYYESSPERTVYKYCKITVLNSKAVSLDLSFYRPGWWREADTNALLKTGYVYTQEAIIG